MFRFFFFVMFAALFVFGCSPFDADPVSVVSVSPPDGSTIEPLVSIVVEFTDVPENLHIYRRLNADSWDEKIYSFSLSGRIATIDAPFSDLQYSKDFTKIIEGLELHLFWGRAVKSPTATAKLTVEELYTHLLKYSVEPHWADEVLTINVGNYQDSWEIFREMEDRNIVMSRSIETYIGKFPMSRTQKSVDVAIVKLLDVGFLQPVTIEKIRQRFSELGYRPLTLEEAVELRLQFTDQPLDDVLMNGFTALLSEKSMRLLRASVDRNTDFGALIGPCDEDKDKDIDEFWDGTLQIVNVPGFIDLSWQRGGPALRVQWLSEDTLLNPNHLNNPDVDVFTRALSKFACVIE